MSTPMSADEQTLSERLIELAEKIRVNYVAFERDNSHDGQASEDNLLGDFADYIATREATAATNARRELTTCTSQVHVLKDDASGCMCELLTQVGGKHE